MRKLLLCAAILAFAPAFAWAQVSSDDIGLDQTAQEANYATGSGTELGTYLGEHIITPFFSVLGIIMLVLIIYGGILWMTSMGNTDQVKKAKDVLINSLIGLVIIVLAYALTRFIFQAISGI